MCCVYAWFFVHVCSFLCVCAHVHRIAYIFVYGCLVLMLEYQYAKDGNVTALIWGASPQSRSDRRKDRVETKPEQLAAASAQAEISFTVLV